MKVEENICTKNISVQIVKNILRLLHYSSKFVMERSVEQKSMDGLCIQPFDAVPDFTLESVLDGFSEKFTLSSLKGKYIVLLFYPVDFGYVTWVT